jgi:predicted dehydrogenase
VGEIIQVNTPTHYEAFLTLASGINVSLLTSFDIYQSRQTNIEIYGTKGTLYVPDPNIFGGTIEYYDGKKKELIQYPLEFGYAENSRCLGLDDLAKALETGRPGRTTSLQTFHVLEAMAGIMESAKTGTPYIMTSHFEREAPMDPSLPNGIL